MQVFDIIVLALFIPVFIRGIRKGFVTQAVALVALILGVWLSYHFSGTVSGWLRPCLDVSPQILQIIAFLVILVGVILGLTLLGKVLLGLVKLVMLGWLDKMLGVVFATLQYVLAAGLLVLLFDTLNTRFEFVPQARIDQTLFYRPLKDIADAVFPYLKELLFKK